MKKALIFDLDGTVLDTLDDLADALNYALADRGFPLRTREEVRQFVGNGIANLVARGVPRGVDGGSTEGVLRVFRGYYGEHCQDQTAPYPGIPELLDKLRENGYLLALLSNKADGAVQALCRKFFPGQFHYVAGEREGVPRKPDPAGVMLALEALGVTAEQAVYIGDSEVDVATAHNAGLDMAIVTWGFRDRETLEAAGGENLADTPEELLAALAAL